MRIMLYLDLTVKPLFITIAAIMDPTKAGEIHSAPYCSALKRCMFGVENRWIFIYI